MKSPEHYYATLNYVHHNPVKHGYTAKWGEWPWSSAIEYLKEIDTTEVTRLWKTYPITRYGDGWDDADM